MNILRPAIEAQRAGSAIEADVGGRFYYKTSPTQDVPRVVYSGVVITPSNVFAKKGESVLLQFDLFSAVSAGDSEIETMETDLKALFDDCTLTLATGYTLNKFDRVNVIPPQIETVALTDGTSDINHTIVEYEVDYQVT